MHKARQAIPNFCGATFTSTEVRDLLNCHRLPGEPFKLLSGFDEVLLPCLVSGVTAAVGASYNFMAPTSLGILEALTEGDLENARRVQNQVLEAVLTIASHGQAIACFKAAMNILGHLDVGPPRFPLEPLSQDALENLTADLNILEDKEILQFSGSLLDSLFRLEWRPLFLD
ncbi:hypothetical protein JTE90_000466 [Oedothorax gibbosus]|uniref:N-acetylneuraminate lyase n=1 Tax=Oedothorax gibbosus TaxID=931172 RepID=A0AAV6TQP6_9ARAC|nr:hypothetical protein JTE90_000466 [Oedothorax gibbosus]